MKYRVWRVETRMVEVEADNEDSAYALAQEEFYEGKGSVEGVTWEGPEKVDYGPGAVVEKDGRFICETCGRDYGASDDAPLECEDCKE